MKYKGKKIVPSVGPKDARIVLVGESPAFNELKAGEPLVGAAGRVLNTGLNAAGISRSDCYIMNVVPIRPPEDKFANHDIVTLQWGIERMEAELAELSPDLVVALGQDALRALLGGSFHSIMKWRGSLLDPDHWPLATEGVAPTYRNVTKRPWPVLASLDPAAVHRQFKWMKWFKLDMKKAGTYLRGEWEWARIGNRKWVLNQPELFSEFVDGIINTGHVVGVDSETVPLPIVSFATDWEVHSFVMDQQVRPHVRRLMECEHVLKVAHNVAHDWIWFEDFLEVPVKPKYVDTQGLMHNLEPEAQKSLSPHLSTLSTSWPYHKWMSEQDAVLYCAMDSAVCFDGYWSLIRKVIDSGLYEIVEHDQILNRHLLKMTQRGLRVDEGKRKEVERELWEDLRSAEDEFIAAATPLIEKKLRYFQKPHLFEKTRSCECCGGGKVQCQHCWRCGGLEAKPERKADYATLMEGVEKWTVAEAKELLPACRECDGDGKVVVQLPINIDSTDQVKDILYRGQSLRPRKFKGSETIRIEQLEPLEDEYPLIKTYLRAARINAEIGTVARLRPDADGRIRSVLDPWGTVSGRVASKEGLLYKGTNLMNVPYKGRKFIVADPGMFFLYPDMDQIEARAVAVLSRDPKLMDIFKRAEIDPSVDFHTEVMDMIFDTTGFDFNSINIGPHAGDGRFFSKKTSYAKFYGIRPEQLAKELGVDTYTTARIVDAYDRTFVGVPAYHEKIESEMQRARTWTSPTGRKRRFLDRILEAKSYKVSYEYLKKGWSGPPQDMAAYVLALGLFKADELYSELLIPYLHVHDALLFQAPLDRREEAVEAVRDSLTVRCFDMLFTCGVSVGPDWFCASLDDEDKDQNGYSEWTLKNFLRSPATTSTPIKESTLPDVAVVGAGKSTIEYKTT